jgi:hypothetical protein
MPRKAKDEISSNEEKKVKKATKKTSASSTEKKPAKEKAKKATEKKVSSKKTETKKTKDTKASVKDEVEKKVVKKAPSKKASTKSTTNTKSSSSSVKSVQKSNTDNTKKSVRRTRNTSKKAKKIEILEYYDLPYRYNQTIVKVLAQTPNILFVYWDISDEDKQNYINQYGEYFFNDTKPVLIIYNDTKKYSFEIDINDFANSWYLHILDSNCKYRVELGRRPINKYARIDNYLYVSSSNNMDAPNDHILFDTLNNNVYFRNVKTNITTRKDITLSFFSRIGKIYNVKDFYKQLYKDEDINFEKLNLKNMPSS